MVYRIYVNSWVCQYILSSNMHARQRLIILCTNHWVQLITKVFAALYSPKTRYKSHGSMLNWTSSVINLLCMYTTISCGTKCKSKTPMHWYIHYHTYSDEISYWKLSNGGERFYKNMKITLKLFFNQLIKHFIHVGTQFNFSIRYCGIWLYAFITEYSNRPASPNNVW